MGVAPPGPRRRDVRRPPGPRGAGAARVPSRGRAGSARGGAAPELGVGRPGLGRGPGAPRGHREPRALDGRDRDRRLRARGAGRGRDAPVRDRGPDRGLGGASPALPLPRPAASRDDEGPRDAARDQRDRARRDGIAGVPRGRDPAARPQHPRGRARLPRPLAAVAGHVLRAPAVAAAAQAAADGGRTGSLLPDRPVPARRAAARRPQLTSSRSSTSRCRSWTRRTCSR